MAEDRELIRAELTQMAQDAIEQSAPAGWFEPVYARAQGDWSQIPWADLGPNSYLTSWLDENPIQGQALVIGCGLGDDAEELARRGMAVTAFDISPTAIEACQARFPDSTVEYQVADLFDPPSAWDAAFDFVFECHTLQALPLESRAQVMPELAGFLREGGQLLLVARGREEDEALTTLPWPLAASELRPLEEAGLELLFRREFADREEPPVGRLIALFRK